MPRMSNRRFAFTTGALWRFLWLLRDKELPKRNFGDFTKYIAYRTGSAQKNAPGKFVWRMTHSAAVDLQTGDTCGLWCFVGHGGIDAAELFIGRIIPKPQPAGGVKC